MHWFYLTRVFPLKRSCPTGVTRWSLLLQVALPVQPIHQEGDQRDDVAAGAAKTVYCPSDQESKIMSVKQQIIDQTLVSYYLI